MRCIIILIALLATHQQDISLEPKYSWPYSNYLGNPTWVSADVADKLALHCSRLVEKSFELEPLELRVRRTDELDAKMEIEDDIVMADIFCLGKKVNLWHLAHFAHVFTHELSEWVLASESFRDGTLYKHDPTNRWIGEGIAEYISTKAFVQAKKHSLLAPDKHCRVALLQDGMEQGIKTISLSGWAISLKGVTQEKEPWGRLRYPAAEYLISKWVFAAKSKGLKQPLCAMYQRLKEHPGPKYGQITTWMEEVSSLPIAQMAESINTKLVYEYFNNF